MNSLVIYIKGENKKMETKIKDADLLRDYIVGKKSDFQESLLSEAKNVRGEINQILKVGNIDLLSNAQKLVICIIEKRDEELLAFANQEGIAWATHSLTLAFKLEWVQAIRRTIWKFIHQFNDEYNVINCMEDFIVMEKEINDQVDQFLNSFFLSYTRYKDALIEAQKELVDNLSVPIIPITSKVCILPLIGALDYYRANIIEEKVFDEISRLKMQTLIIDLSGIADMEVDVIDRLLKVIEGTVMMGCESVVTGIRPDVVRKMIALNMSFEKRANTKGTLQQALKEYM